MNSGSPGRSFIFKKSSRTTVVTAVTIAVLVLSGLDDLALFQSAGSQFHTYYQDRYTTLGEARDRTYATLVHARWRHQEFVDGADWTASYQRARDRLVDTFTTIRSQSTQQVLYTMGRDLLEACPAVVEIRLSMPNLHHLEVDLSPFGLENHEEVLFPTDQPFGLMEGTVLRDDAPDPGLAWW